MSHFFLHSSAGTFPTYDEKHRQIVCAAASAVEVLPYK